MGLTELRSRWKRGRVFAGWLVGSHGLHLFILAAFVIAAVFSVIAFIVPVHRINIVIWVAVTLAIATIFAHVAAGRASLNSKWWTSFWRWIDYLWVLAAFGALLIGTAKSDLDRAKQEAIQSEILLAQIAARIDQRCDETLKTIAYSSNTGSIVHATLRECIALKIPTLGNDAASKWMLDGVLAQLKNDATRRDSAMRVGALLTIPVFLRPVEGHLLAQKESVCSNIIQREKLPAPLMLSGLNEGLATMIVDDFLGRLYPEPKDGKPYWRPTPQVLAEERAFKNDEIVFCAGIKNLLSSSRNLENRQKLWGMIKFLVDHLQAWFLAFAVFAGLRLGRSAFDSRPRP